MAIECRYCGEEIVGAVHAATRYHDSCRKLHKAEYMRAWNQDKRAQVFAHYGDTCACCGETRREFLTIDHIEGNGTRHRRAVGDNTAAWLVKNNFPPEYRILCANCNFSLGVLGYCPHDYETERNIHGED